MSKDKKILFRIFQPIEKHFHQIACDLQVAPERYQAGFNGPLEITITTSYSDVRQCLYRKVDEDGIIFHEASRRRNES